MPRYLPAPELPRELEAGDCEPNEVPAEAMGKIAIKIRNYSCENGKGMYRGDLIDFVAHKWMVRNKEEGKTGSLLRRIKSRCAEIGVKLTNDQWSEVGQLIAFLKATAGKTFYKVVDQMDWEPGDYGDGGSCFWGGRDQAREVLEERLGAKFILLRGKREDGSWYGYGRCIAIPLSTADLRFRGWSLLNYYGPGGREDEAMANVAVHFAKAMGLTYYGVHPTEFSGGGTGLLYLNGGNSAIFSDEATVPLLEQYFEDDRDWRDEARGVSRRGWLTLRSGVYVKCWGSDRWIEKKDAVEVATEDGTYNLFSKEYLHEHPRWFHHCTKCGQLFHVSRFYDGRVDSDICQSCAAEQLELKRLLITEEDQLSRFDRRPQVGGLSRIKPVAPYEWVYRPGRRGERKITVSPEKLRSIFGVRTDELLATS